MFEDYKNCLTASKTGNEIEVFKNDSMVLIKWKKAMVSFWGKIKHIKTKK